jgi:hydroxymethylglutaryl-CoA lyase
MSLKKDPVMITEVGPRDGLQNLREYVPTEQKIALVKKLVATGVREIELGSFVHPKAIPQFRDMSEVVAAVIGMEEVNFTTLVPNLRGAQDAIKSGIRTLVFVFSVSKSHNLNNVRRTPEESLSELNQIIDQFGSSPGIRIRSSLATVFGCPFEIKVKTEDIMMYVKRVYDMGIREITLCDTVGFGNPGQISEITGLLLDNFPDVRFAVHLHNTRGLGLANALAAYESGIRHLDSSIAGLGGCPFAPGASGNVATEDMVFMFQEMSIETGISIPQLFEATAYLESILPEIAITSSLYKAGVPGQSKVCS